jgi:hypothetical protein
MKNLKILAATAVISIQIFALGSAASAQTDAAAIAKRATIYSAEGTKIGRVEKVVDGTVRVIYRSKFLAIPTTSLTAQENGYKTTLTNSELNKM